MNEAAKVDVMNDLLFSTGARDLPQVEELNNLLYREEGDRELSDTVVQLAKPVTRSNGVYVEMLDQRCKIRVRVPRSLASELTIEQVTEAAVEAINHQLKKVMT